MNYLTIKNLIPIRLRSTFKPLYLLWNLRGFNGQQSVEVCDDDIQFFIHIDRNNGAVDEYIFIHRNWEVHVGAVLRSVLQPGGVFVDVGANIGYFSLLAASLVGESGRVVAFEPLPKLVQQIRRSADQNQFNWLHVVPKALGKIPGVMSLALAAGNIGGSSLVASQQSGNRVEVEVGTLNTELADFERIDLMKIDVEGFEYEMLVGAKEVLERYRPVLVLEFSPSFYAKRDESMGTDILLLLKKIGYTFMILQTKATSNDVDGLLSMIAGKQVDLLCTISKEEKK